MSKLLVKKPLARPAPTPVLRPQLATKKLLAHAPPVPVAVSTTAAIGAAAKLRKLPVVQKPKLAAPAKRAAVIAPAAAAAAAKKSEFKAAADPILSSCGPCTLTDSIPFCVRVVVPDGFTVVSGAVVCVALQTAGVTCDSQACETPLSGITIENPCDPTSFITCSGTVTLYKLHLGGSIDVIVNLPVVSSNTSDVTSCPDTSMQLSRQICVPVDNDVCIGCSPVDCTAAGVTLVTSVTVTDSFEAAAGDTVAGCEAIWQIEGFIALNSGICTGIPPPAQILVTGTVQCDAAQDTNGFTVQLFPFPFGPMSDQQIITSSGVFSLVAPAPGTYYIVVRDASNTLIYTGPPTAIPASTNVGIITVPCAAPQVGSITVDYQCASGNPPGLTFFLVETSQSVNNVPQNTPTTFSNLAPGTYTVQLQNGFGFVIDTQVLTVTAGNDTSFTFVAETCPFFIQGTISCTGGNDVTGYTVELHQTVGDALIYSVVVDGSGFFAVYAPVSDSYYIVVRDNFNNIIYTGPPAIYPGNTTVAPLVIPCAAFVNGQATQPVGCTITDFSGYTAQLYEVGPPATPIASTLTNLDVGGAFSVPTLGVPSGTYFLVIFDPSNVLVYSQSVTITAGISQNVGNTEVQCPTDVQPDTLVICFDPNGCAGVVDHADLINSSNVIQETVPFLADPINCGEGGGFSFGSPAVPPGFYTIDVYDAANVLLASFAVASTGGTIIYSASC